jgi:hypothetical protein
VSPRRRFFDQNFACISNFHVPPISSFLICSSKSKGKIVPLFNQVPRFTPRPLYLRYPLDRRLGGPQSRPGRGSKEKRIQFRSFRESSPGRPARSLITILTELLRFLCLGCHAVQFGPKFTFRHDYHPGRRHSEHPTAQTHFAKRVAYCS